jgi:hypothetical protein
VTGERKGSFLSKYHVNDVPLILKPMFHLFGYGAPFLGFIYCLVVRLTSKIVFIGYGNFEGFPGINLWRLPILLLISISVLLFGCASILKDHEPKSALGTLRATDGGQESVAAFGDGHTVVVFAHQDDDLIYMLPFWPVASKFLLAAYPAAPVFQDLVQSFPAELSYHGRWTPIWGAVDNDVWAVVFTDFCKRAPIVNVATIKAHLRPYLVPPIKRVITHNNWGEYGHVQHRVVNIAVRELAVETGLDVWAPGTRVPDEAGGQSTEVDVASELGLPTIEGYFDPGIFRSVREAYQAHRPVASTPELTATFLNWASTLWTGSDRPEDDYTGWRPFIKLVDRGVDLTAENSSVRRLERDVTVVNECPTNPVLP